MKELICDEERFLFKEHQSCPCVNLEGEAFDLNKIKSKLYKDTEINQPKTVSGLCFNRDGAIVLIQFENHNLLGIDRIEEINKELSNGDLKAKIEGSISVLKDYCKKLNVKFDDFYNPSKLGKIKTIILMNIPDKEYTKMRISNLDKLNITSEDELIGEIMILTCEDFKL